MQDPRAEGQPSQYRRRMKSDNMGNRRFKDLLEASMKSKDTEEWLDVHFTRPIGLFFALIW